MSDPRAKPAAEPEGRLGPYTLLRVIGEGGMGVVHLAEDASGAQVALKVLRPQVVSDQEARTRLAREVAALSRVTSPRVAEIIDADPWGPAPYVVTRYVEGPSLREHVHEHGAMPEPVLRRFAAGLAEALAAVHRVGVLHRDVKPGNVLVEQGRAVLIDFGLARMTEDTHITSAGWMLGTPGYLAPEILYGEEPTTASDVHSWAATVAFAATGRPPAGTGPALAIMDRVRRGELDLRAVPPSIAPLLRACLDPDPRQRPGVDHVLQVLGATPPSAPAPEPTLRIDRTRAWSPAPLDAAPETEEGLLATEPSSRPRRLAGRLGIGLAAVGLTAWAPYVGLMVLAIAVTLLRFGSVAAERHGRRRTLRGRARWYDVPASTLASPLYLVLSLVGTLLLLGSAVVIALVVALLALELRLHVLPGLGASALALVLALWWGPGAARVREGVRRLTRSMGRPTRTGPMALVLGVLLVAVFAIAIRVDGPWWAPSTTSPWSHGWGQRVVDRLR